MELVELFKNLSATTTGLVEKTAQITANLESFVINMNTAVKGINEAALSSDQGLASVSKTISGLIDSGKALNAIMGNIAGDNPLKQLIDSSLTAFEKVKDVGLQTVNFYDNATSRQRDLEVKSYESLAKFGRSFEEVRESGKIFDDILVSNSKMIGSLSISGTELSELKERFESNGVVITKQTDTMKVLGQEISAIQIAYLQSAKVGMNSYEYANQLSKMMREQGSSFEGATITIAGYGEIAEKSGLQTSTMINSISSATSNFEKLGVTVAFGRPIMEGFAESVSKIGIGIENASGLAATFSRSLLDVANNYGMAYIISQKAGMDTGGGFLGASIKMQGMFEGASPGEQEQAAVTTAMGMKKYLEDMFGGQIVTRREAEKSPELGLSFYAQQQSLMSTFGIGDQGSATRTLEMLEEIDSAMAAGDEELANRLSEDLQKQGKTEDQLLSETQKMGIAIQGMAVETSVQTALLAAQVKKTLGDDFEKSFQQLIESVGTAYNKETEKLTGEFAAANKLTDKEEKDERLITLMGNVRAMTGEKEDSSDSGGAAFSDTDVSRREENGVKYIYVKAEIKMVDRGQTNAQAIEEASSGLGAASGTTNQAGQK